MSNSKNHTKVLKLVQLGVLAAIIIIMAFTPLGYLKVGVVSITFIMIPVVIGAIVVGPAGGAVLGGVFGITSFIQCFGMDAFGTTLANINIFYTAVMCLIPRILMGFLSGIIFKGLYKVDPTKTKIISFCVSSLSGAVINTVLFVGSLLLFFYNTDYIQSFGDSVFAVIGVLVTANSLIEMGVCLVVGAAVSKALIHFIPANSLTKKEA